jgi:O6-methylguanine-DNA--protein-cysteine methyltransferase
MTIKPGALVATIFAATPTRGTLHLLLRGTNFQIKVWEALIRVEPGAMVFLQRTGATGNGSECPARCW